MKAFTYFLFIILISRHAAAGETQFEKLLKRNETYKSIADNVSSGSGTNEDLTQLKSTISAYIQEREKSSHGSSANPVSQFELDLSACTSCPGYLNLTSNISKIVERLDKGDSITEANQAILDQNNLKFLYYSARFEMADGRVTCQKYGNSSVIESNQFKGSFKVLAEQVFDLPNINEAQLIPPNGGETVYLYRGQGSQRNVVIELRMRKDGKAQMTYYQYTPSSAELLALQPKGPNAVELIIDAVKKRKTEPQGDNFIKADLDIKTSEGSLLPSDLSLVKARTTSNLSDELVLKTNTQISYNEQSTEVALASDTGKNWVVIQAKNQTAGDKQFVTTVPLSFELDKESALRVGASVKQELVLTESEADSLASTRTVSMNLTDHNTKYFDIRLYNREADKFQKISVSNEFDAGFVGRVGTKYESDSNGRREFSLQQRTNLGSNGVLSTEFGTGEGDKFVGVKHEVAFGSATTLSLGARIGESKQNSILFQFSSKF